MHPLPMLAADNQTHGVVRPVAMGSLHLPRRPWWHGRSPGTSPSAFAELDSPVIAPIRTYATFGQDQAITSIRAATIRQGRIGAPGRMRHREWVSENGGTRASLRVRVRRGPPPPRGPDPAEWGGCPTGPRESSSPPPWSPGATFLLGFPLDLAREGELSMGPLSVHRTDDPMVNRPLRPASRALGQTR